MASATSRVDELVKDYLLFRGMITTLRQFDAELKNDKEKGLRVIVCFLCHAYLSVKTPYRFHLTRSAKPYFLPFGFEATRTLGRRQL